MRPHHLQNEEWWVGIAEPRDDTHLARLTEERVCPVPGGWRVVGVGAPEAAGAALGSQQVITKGHLKAIQSAVGSRSGSSARPG